jgi:restriction system protein
MPFSRELAEKLAMGSIGVKLKPAAGIAASEGSMSIATTSATSPLASPDDRLGQAVAELRQSAVAELLEVLAAVSPSFFETIVLDLLHRMGYGAKRSDLQKVGGTGDGGIDGIISLDRLGLEKVYVQAKRWQENIGRPQLQAFYGALAGQKAKKGVFITTSGYTQQAVDFARSVEGIVLIDGARLADLMIDHEVGITARTVKIPKVDSDYFDEEAT